MDILQLFAVTTTINNDLDTKIKKEEIDEVSLDEQDFEEVLEDLYKNELQEVEVEEEHKDIQEEFITELEVEIEDDKEEETIIISNGNILTVEDLKEVEEINLALSFDKDDEKEIELDEDKDKVLLHLAQKEEVNLEEDKKELDESIELENIEQEQLYEAKERKSLYSKLQSLQLNIEENEEEVDSEQNIALEDTNVNINEEEAEIQFDFSSFEEGKSNDNFQELHKNVAKANNAVVKENTSSIEIKTPEVETEVKVDTDVQKIDISKFKMESKQEMVNFNTVNFESDKLKPQDIKPLPKFEIEIEVGKKDWGESLNNKILFMFNKNINFAEIKLRPPDLGPIEISINTNKQDQTKVMFVAQSSLTKDAIEGSIPKLKEMFLGEGLNLVDVGVTDEETLASNNEAYDEYKRNKNMFRDSGESYEEEEVIYYSRHDGLIDLYS